MEKRFTIAIDSNDRKSLWDEQRTEEEPLLWLTRSYRIGGIDDVCKLLNELHDKNEQLKLDLKVANDGADLYKDINEALENENEQLKQQIKDLRINVLNSIHKADEIQCSCNPCVVEECVKRVVE